MLFFSNYNSSVNRLCSTSASGVQLPKLSSRSLVGHNPLQVSSLTVFTVFPTSTPPLTSPPITEMYVCGVWLLASQKPINRPGWWKGKFISDAGNWGGGKGEDISPKAESPPPLPAHHKQEVRAFIDRVRRDTALLPTKVHLVKAMIFPAVMYGCESWTIKKAEH